MKTLTEQVADFLYTHMAQAPNRKELLKLVENVEFQYITRITQLQKELDQKNAVPVERDWHNFD